VELLTLAFMSRIRCWLRENGETLRERENSENYVNIHPNKGFTYVITNALGNLELLDIAVAA